MSSTPIAVDGSNVCTFRDFLNTVAEDQKAHLLEGFIIMESPASTRHEELQSFLSMLVGTFVAEKQLGKVFGAKAAFKLIGYNSVEPDLGFVSTGRLGLVKQMYVAGAPDLAVEVISKGTRKLDYEKKRPAYERSGTGELWLIDYLRHQVDLFCSEGGRFVQPALERGRFFNSRVLPGFRLDVRWFWRDPLPRPQPILARLLRA